MKSLLKSSCSSLFNFFDFRFSTYRRTQGKCTQSQRKTCSFLMVRKSLAIEIFCFFIPVIKLECSRLSQSVETIQIAGGRRAGSRPRSSPAWFFDRPHWPRAWNRLLSSKMVGCEYQSFLFQTFFSGTRKKSRHEEWLRNIFSFTHSKFQDFFPRDIESCRLAAVLLGTSPVD